MHEGRHVQQLDRDARGDELLGYGLPRADEDQHRPQALAARGERPGDMTLERLAVTLRDAPKAGLGAVEELREPVAPGREHLRDLRETGRRGQVARRAHVASTSPAWIAMIPPAVRSQRTFTRPTAAIAAARPRASGNRRTELGR